MDMKKRNLFFDRMAAVVLAGTMCVSLLFTGCGMDEAEEAAVKDRVFMVNQSAICTVAQAKVLLQEERMKIESLYGSGIWNIDVGSSNMEKAMRDTVLNQLENLEKAVIFANENGVTLTDSERALCFRKADAYLATLSAAEITSMGVTRENVGELYAKFYLIEKTYDQMTKSCENEVSDTEALVIDVQYILCGSKENADFVKDCLNQDTDIYYLAEMYSLAGSVDNSVYRGEKGDDFDAVAFSLKEGETSNPVKTADGYYIIRCTSIYNKAETQKRKEMLSENIKEEYFKELFSAAEGNYSVKLYDNVWDDITILRDFGGSSFFAVYENDNII